MSMLQQRSFPASFRNIIKMGAIISASLAVTAVNAADISLKLGHVGAPISPQETIAKLFSEKVTAYSNGSLKIQIFNSGGLGNERQLQEGVRSGTIDMTIAGTFSHFVPWAGALETPMLYQGMDHFTRFFSSTQGDALLEQFRKDVNVEPLFVVPHGGFRYITVKGKEVRSPADLKGVKIRNPNVPAFNIMAKAVDAIPIPIDFSELYVALQRGVVDGQHNPIGNIVGAKLYEVQKSLSMVPWGISPHIVSMSKAAWGRLDDAQKSAVKKAAQETVKEYPDIARQEEQELLESIKGAITILPPEQIDLAGFAKVFQEKGLPLLKAEYGENGGRWLDAINASRQ
jgi:C4-dicarboxylate-binding protein DctP